MRLVVPLSGPQSGYEASCAIKLLNTCYIARHVYMHLRSSLSSLPLSFPPLSLSLPSSPFPPSLPHLPSLPPPSLPPSFPSLPRNSIIKTSEYTERLDQCPSSPHRCRKWVGRVWGWKHTVPTLTRLKQTGTVSIPYSHIIKHLHLW